MPQVNGRITIDAPADAVHSAILAVEEYPAWAEGVREAEVLERDGRDRPARARFVIQTPLGEVGYTLTYAYDGASGVSWQLADGDLLQRFDGSYTLTPAEQATELECTIDLVVDLPLPGMVAKQAAGSILTRGLESLRDRAEERADGT